MNSSFFIPVIEGTTRPKRRSLQVAQLIHSTASTIDGVESVLVDPTTYVLPFDGNDTENKDSRYSDLTLRADAFFIVVPEYNHSFPGSLKRLLDSELKNYLHKPVAFAGVSVSPWGGIRAIEALVPCVREMGLIATAVDLQFPMVDKLFDANGELTDAAYIGRIQRSYTELLWMAKTLRWGREQSK